MRGVVSAVLAEKLRPAFKSDASDLSATIP